MIRILEAICIAATLFMGFMIIMYCIDEYGKFEYTTPSGEKGEATFCVVSHGSAHCTTEDNRLLMVESFRKVD